MIGRYINDAYYNGHAWILCTLAMLQYRFFSEKVDKCDMSIDLNPKSILKYILEIDANLDLAEQYDPVNKKQLSAKQLTWNYAELYFVLESLLHND